jgi:hypothetical protein
MSVGALIVSTTGERIVGMSSKVQRIRTISSPSRRWAVRCDMGKLPLNAGTYFVHVYIGNGAVDVARFLQPFEIRIGENDVFGWGNSVPAQTAWGPFYWAPSWQIASTADPHVADVQAGVAP